MNSILKRKKEKVNFVKVHQPLDCWFDHAFDHRGLLRIFFNPSTTLKKKTLGRNLKCQIFIQHFFKIVLYWCLDLIRNNIGTPNKYIFDIPIPFCHNLSATFKQFLTEFAGPETVDHIIRPIRSHVRPSHDGWQF
jgi:hypothetical protein